MGYPLLRKHLLQHAQRLGKRPRCQSSEPPDQPSPIHGTELIKDDVTVLPLKSARNPERVGVTTGCHRSHKKRSEVIVEFVGRHYHARPRLLDLAAPRRA